MPREADLPPSLSPDDVARYRRVFALQQAGKFSDADREIAGLGDRLLVGVILAQRYRSPSYRASYAELAQWLRNYADEPDAKAIYAMAMKRHPAGTPLPSKPIAPSTPAQSGDDSDMEPSPADNAKGGEFKAIVPTNDARAEALRQQIGDIAAKQPRRAELLLASREAKQLIDSGTRDELRSAIAEGYLAQGEAQEALSLSAATESPAYAPIANWNAGLAAWRLGRLDEARGHFDALARSPGQSPWVKSAAAFWAARVELRAGRPENYGYWLRLAAENPRTFYGLLARSLLGLEQPLSFDPDPFTSLDAQVLGAFPAGQRILALLAVDEPEAASAEMLQLASHGSTPLLHSLVAISDRANLPAASLQLAAVLGNDDNRAHVPALYPVPRWEPLGGFTVDRALIFALMRQESQFVPRARNQSGATGLMQLMPATARSMARRTGAPLAAAASRTEREQLSNPGYNLMLAQEYVRLLLKDDRIKDNLILFAVAYNHGPAAADRWLGERPEYNDDPLLYIESIPSQESRVFTLRVLTNYWMYRLRLNQPSPDLDALAAGHWPIYTALDPPDPATDRRHAQN